MSDTKRETPGRDSPGLAAAISATLGVAGAASAQTSGGLETIVVTATRRAENLQNVPESISAFDTEAIEMRGLKQMDDYAKFVPGLSLGVREPGGTTIVFRGVALVRTAVRRRVVVRAISGRAADHAERPQSRSAADRHRAPRGAARTAGDALRRELAVRARCASSPTSRIRRSSMPGSTGRSSTIEDGGTGYDVSAMVNVPLVADRLALRLVGFTAEDAGLHRQRAERQPGAAAARRGPFDNANQVDKDVKSRTTTGGRAALRWDVSDNVDVTLGALFQDLGRRPRRRQPRRRRTEQVRFEEESLDDKWYQVALTLNASLPFGDLVVSASYFDRDFRYEADATDYEFTFQPELPGRDTVTYDSYAGLRFRRRPPGLRDEPRADRDHDGRGAAAVAGRFGEPLGVAGPAPSTARRRATRSSTATSAATRTPARSTISAYYEQA